MPKVSYAELFSDWDTLLANARAHVEKEVALGPLLDRLQALRLKIQELCTLRDHLRAESQVLSQEIDALRFEGKDLAVDARCILKGTLGSRGEELTAFGIRPRKRTYKKRKKTGAKAVRKAETATRTTR